MTLPWNKDATDLLLRLADVYKGPRGGRDWEQISGHFPARTGKACECHWLRLQAREDAVITDTTIDDPPSYQQLFTEIRDNPKTLTQLSNKFDRSPKVIRRKLDEMEEAAYNLVITKDHFAVQTSTRPTKQPPEISIADLMGREFCIAIASDWHAGSQDAQPTSQNEFIHYAYQKYGVRHILVPGDLTDGVYVYRGHLNNLIPQVRPLTRSMAWMSTEAQVQLCDIYAPKLSDLKYYVMGGNHDWKHVVVAGRDPIRMLCDRRDDMIYGGYNSWGIPLTEKAYIRLVHPTGGVSYARSYKLQKGIENLAFEALREAMREDAPPIVSILVMGHFHLTNYTPEHPLHGVLAGCFQGQTDFMQVRNMVPHIAGIILQLKVNDRGKIGEIGYRIIPFDEIKQDWKNWPTPEIALPDVNPEETELLFSITGEDPIQEKGTE